MHSHTARKGKSQDLNTNPCVSLHRPSPYLQAWARGSVCGMKLYMPTVWTHTYKVYACFHALVHAGMPAVYICVCWYKGLGNVWSHLSVTECIPVHTWVTCVFMSMGVVCAHVCISMHMHCGWV